MWERGQRAAGSGAAGRWRRRTRGGGRRRRRARPRRPGRSGRARRDGGDEERGRGMGAAARGRHEHSQQRLCSSSWRCVELCGGQTSRAGPALAAAIAARAGRAQLPGRPGQSTTAERRRRHGRTTDPAGRKIDIRQRAAGRDGPAPDSVRTRSSRPPNTARRPPLHHHSNSCCCCGCGRSVFLQQSERRRSLPPLRELAIEMADIFPPMR